MTLPAGYPNPKLISRQVDRTINQAVRTLEHQPILGPWITRLSYIKSITAVPCAPTPEIWIEAFIQGFGVALWNAFKPSPTDFMAQRFGAGDEHGHGTGTRKPRFNLDVQLTEPLGKLDPGDGPGLYALRGVQLLRRIGFYLTIADFLTDGLAISVSMAYVWSGCNVSGSITAQGHWPAGTVILFSGAWLPVGSPTWDFINGVSTGGGGVFTNANKSWFISWALGARMPDIPGYPATTYEFRLVGSNGDEHPATSRSTIAQNNNEQISFGTLTNVAPGIGSQGYAIQYRITGGGAGIITGGHFTYTETFDGMNPLVSPVPDRRRFWPWEP